LQLARTHTLQVARSYHLDRNSLRNRTGLAGAWNEHASRGSYRHRGSEGYLPLYFATQSLGGCWRDFSILDVNRSVRLPPYPAEIKALASRGAEH